MGFGHSGIGGGGTTVTIFRFVKRICLLVKQAQIYISPGVARIKLRDPFVMALCRVEISRFFLKQAESKVNIRSVWSQQICLF
jgi:hypothetical protein